MCIDSLHEFDTIKKKKSDQKTKNTPYLFIRKYRIKYVEKKRVCWKYLEYSKSLSNKVFGILPESLVLYDTPFVFEKFYKIC